MSGIVAALTLFSWLMLGGWACHRIGNAIDFKKDLMGAVIVACLLLGPFMAGVAIAADHNRSEPDEEKP